MVNETSTPKRVSFFGDKFTKNVTPLRRKTIFNLQKNNDKDVDIEQGNNDEEERSIRRRSVAELRRSLTPNLNVSTTSSASPITNISSNAIESHFKTCLTLFTSNKINSDNVWNLNCLDYLKSLLLKKIDTTLLLQTASTAVDITTKVYSLRIDDTHTNVLKFINQLSKHKVASDDDPQNDSNAEQMDVDQENAENDNEKKKKKPKPKSSKKKSTIVDDDEALNAPVEVHKLLGIINENENTKESMLSKPIKDFEVLSVVQSRNIMWGDVKFDKNTKNVHPSLQLPKATTAKICPSFKDFILDDWDINKDETLNDSIDMDKADHNDGENPWQIEPHPNEMNESVLEDLGIQGEHNEPEPVFLTSLRPALTDITSNQRYSMFAHRPLPTIHDRVWAGPAHWKWKMLRKNRENISSHTNLNQDAQKAKKPRKIINPINFSKLLNKKKLLSSVIKPEKHTKSANTRKTVKINSTLPENLDISKHCCLTLCSNKNILVKNKIDKSEELQENLNNTYAYDNPDDNDYCNLTVHEPEAHDEDGCQGDGDLNHSVNSEEEFNNINCEKINKDSVPFALKAKRMDMKKLKGYISEEINEHKEKEKETISPIKLSEVYTHLPEKMPSSMSENLSSALALVALLHLANEQNLYLESVESGKDIMISKTSSSNVC